MGMRGHVFERCDRILICRCCSRRQSCFSGSASLNAIDEIVQRNQPVPWVHFADPAGDHLTVMRMRCSLLQLLTRSWSTIKAQTSLTTLLTTNQASSRMVVSTKVIGAATRIGDR